MHFVGFLGGGLCVQITSWKSGLACNQNYVCYSIKWEEMQYWSIVYLRCKGLQTWNKTSNSVDGKTAERNTRANSILKDSRPVGPQLNDRDGAVQRSLIQWSFLWRFCVTVALYWRFAPESFFLVVLSVSGQHGMMIDGKRAGIWSFPVGMTCT